MCTLTGGLSIGFLLFYKVRRVLSQFKQEYELVRVGNHDCNGGHFKL
jgi:hypothetical protein